MAERTTSGRARRWRSDWARIGPWRGRAEVAHIVVDTERPATARAVDDCLRRLRRAGYSSAITSALTPPDALPFVDNGFDLRERLHLLEHAMSTLPEPPPDVSTRRAWRNDRAGVLDVDARAFDGFWQLDADGLDDAIAATPAARFRVVGHHMVAGYAITGRAGRNGYLQRLAVDPQARRRGLGRALVADGLRWLRRADVRRTLVNTQEANAAALALYQDCGFRLLPVGLCVLGRTL